MLYLEILLRSTYQNAAKVEGGLEKKRRCSRVGCGVQAALPLRLSNPIESQSLEYLGAGID